jgi:hypothetical protein
MEDSLKANVPNVAGKWAPVWALAHYKINGQDATQYLNNPIYFRTLLTAANQGTVPIVIDIQNQSKPVLLYAGMPKYVNGQWVVHFNTGQDEPMTDQGGNGSCNSRTAPKIIPAFPIRRIRA